MTIIPLDRTILDKTLTLTTINEMHDRQIAATALVLIDRGESVALLTRDQNIRETDLVAVIWELVMCREGPSCGSGGTEAKFDSPFTEE